MAGSPHRPLSAGDDALEQTLAGLVRVGMLTEAQVRDDVVTTEVLQVLVYILDYGLDPLDAVRLPRIFTAAGNRQVQLSLSRALVALGEAIAMPVLGKAMASTDADIHAHASAAERLLRDPDTGFELAVDEAKRRFVLGKQWKD